MKNSHKIGKDYAAAAGKDYALGKDYFGQDYARDAGKGRDYAR